ncbi:MAG TPA: hypothetical protein VFN53_12205 [Acidobacteriaceae bacterium]|nr:hypothetical protein [Acidobacteriaceae bacterium]
MSRGVVTMMTEEELSRRIANMHLDFLSAQKKQRGWRNKVDPLSLDYEDYRKTRLWKEMIMQRILLRDENKCRRCDGCHSIVHFTSSGVKRTPADQKAALTDLTLNQYLPKVDMRRDPFRIPNWERFTVVQKQTYLDEYNARKMKRSITAPPGWAAC